MEKERNIAKKIASRLMCVPINEVGKEMDKLSENMQELVMQEIKSIRAVLSRKDKMIQALFLDKYLNQDFKNAMLGI